MTASGETGDESPLATAVPPAQKLSALSNWMAYGEAAAIIRQAIGVEPWPLIKRAIRDDVLLARGLADGVLEDVRAIWIDCLAEFVDGDAPDGGMVWRDNEKARKVGRRFPAEAKMPQHITSIELRAPDAQWLAATLAGDPRPHEAAPAGRIFFDAAVLRAAKRLALSPDMAAVLLIRALVGAEATARLRVLDNDTPIASDDWRGAALEARGLRFRGKVWHTHRFVIAEHDLAQWLDREAAKQADALAATGSVRRPWNVQEAKGLLAGKKHAGGWKNAPLWKESDAFLRLNFLTVSNNGHAAIRRELWGPQKRGAKTRRSNLPRETP